MQIKYLLDCIIDIQNDPYIIRLLCRCVSVPAYEAYIARTAHPVLCTHFGFKKGIRAVSCPYPTPIWFKMTHL